MAAANGEPDANLLCKVKTFAFAMLDAAVPEQQTGDYRILEVALCAVKCSMDCGYIDLSQRVIERAAVRLDVLGKSTSDSDGARLQAVTTGYYMCRICLSCLLDRPDIADHLFLKVPATRIKEDQDVFVELCYKVGKLGLAKGQYGLAVKWLQRALAAIEFPIYNEGVDGNMKEKRFLLLHALVRGYLNFDLVDAREYLSKALECMEGEHGAAFPMAVFRLELMKREGFAAQDLFQVVQTAIQSVKINGETLKM
ncbi:hypothetical protein P168DRAFT_47170 [Aspergillus campestris IBT 28561]|uniref:Protein ZIP4 homolog n=1 Tax=Aspergillus campestris (strain IBT 28561) TaxID=1392248 RepID=A0A2I1CUT0_ASPC2|nr:uncharacterized protein P168DRAFT_47170 [Aspergillus campestris IBT 28561]PKY01365.1 hypothetical protein P168DRAFT_47170 [Aspergillus campestris IBT 28561]